MNVNMMPQQMKRKNWLNKKELRVPVINVHDTNIDENNKMIKDASLIIINDILNICCKG